MCVLGVLMGYSAIRTVCAYRECCFCAAFEIELKFECECKYECVKRGKAVESGERTILKLRVF